MAVGQVHIKDLIRAGQRELSLEEDYDYPDLPVKGTVHLNAHLQLSSIGAIVSGVFQGVLQEPCDRCLEPFERPVQSRFEERFVYQSMVEDTMRSGEIELMESDFYDTIGPEGILDVKDLVYQHIILAMSNDRICNRESCEMQS